MKRKIISLILSVAVLSMTASSLVCAQSLSGNEMSTVQKDSESAKQQDVQDPFEWADPELREAIENEFSEGFGGSSQPTLDPEGIYGTSTRYLFYGDSTVHGYENPKDHRYIAAYPYYFQQYMNCYINNRSICGATAAEDYGFNFYNEIYEDTEDLQSYDVAFFQFGINDFCLSYPVGEVDSTDINTVCGGLNYNIQKLKLNGVEPICILPFYYKGQANQKRNMRDMTFDDYIAAIKAVCEKHQVTIIDFNTAFGMNGDNFASYYMDSVHPDDALQQMAGEYLYHFMQSYGDGREKISDFVARLYDKCLDRSGDEEGMAYWKSMLEHNLRTGTGVAYGFIFSEEVTNKNLSDEDFVELLYQAIMGRESDASGKADWLYKMQNGVGREGVFMGFAGSIEFDALCGIYGIQRGTMKMGEARNENPGLTIFVSRLYTKALNRSYEVDGLNDWCGRILSGSWSIDDASTTGFFNSQEFYNRNLSDSDYVKTLYRTFFDREYDEAGYEDWMNQLSRGVSRDEVLRGFADSTEFAVLKQSFGL